MKKLIVLFICLGVSVALGAQTAPAKPSAAHPFAEEPQTSEAVVAPLPVADSTEAAELPALPVGTAIKMKLETPLHTSLNKPGDRFSGRVTEAVMLGERAIIPVGSSLEGEVTRVNEPRRIRGTPTLDLKPQLVVLPNGERYNINAVIVDTSHRPETSVNDEGEIKGRGRDGRDWKETGIGTGAGMLVGGLAAGGQGVLVGGAVGATATVVHWLVKRRSTELPVGTEIVMELSRPVTLSPAASAGQ
jgi:hypothetical protein